ncbi:LysE family translocator [Aquimarina rhabdastrellae]
MIEQLIPFLVASMILTISPGPDNIYVLMQSISHGKKDGIATTAGLVSGILIHTTLIALGVSTIIKESEYIFLGIKILGAGYLLYLAYKVFKAPHQIDLDSGTVQKKTSWALFKQGFIMNVLNPKVTIFFLAFFPAFIKEEQGNVMGQIYMLGIAFMAQAFLIFGAIALLAGMLNVFLKNNAKATLVLKWFQIVVFIGIGLYILLPE